MRGFRVLAMTAAVVAVGIAACGDGGPTAPPREQYTAALSGANEVEPPAKVIGATGTATIVANGNNLTWTITTANFAAGTVAPGTAGGTTLPAHIHNGAAGVNGQVMVPLSAAVNGTMTGTLTVADSVLAKMRAGTAYVNVHTNNRPAGEIRGQLARTP